MNGAELILSEGIGFNEWVQLGHDKFDQLCEEFAAVGENCIIEADGYSNTLYISFDRGLSETETNEYIRRAATWYSYLQTFGVYEYSFDAQLGFNLRIEITESIT